MNNSLERQWQHNSSKTVSEIPGALHRDLARDVRGADACYLPGFRPPASGSTAALDGERDDG